MWIPYNGPEPYDERPTMHGVAAGRWRAKFIVPIK
jgi:hypothetical protein